MKKIFLVLMGVLTFLACTKEKTTVAQHNINITKSQKELIGKSNEFGVNIFKKLELEYPNANIFISPVSISVALAMAYNGATGKTKDDMATTIGYGGLSDEVINSSFKNLMDQLISVDPKVLVNIANSIWYRNTFSILPSFVDVNQHYYYADITPLDFNSPNAVDIINNWVDAKTNHKISSVIRSIPSDMVMYLVNAIYFKGVWQYEFDKTKTEDRPFYLEDGSYDSLPSMLQESSLKYCANESFSAVELPYGQGNYSMIVVLPQFGQSVQHLLESFSAEKWEEITNSMSIHEKVRVQLPKFKFRNDLILNNALSELGMGIAFNPEQADFSEVNPTYKLNISTVEHISYVDVNEEGTEAAAVTVIGFTATAYPSQYDRVYFTVDRPFVFAIRENISNTILFMGKVMKPKLD